MPTEHLARRAMTVAGATAAALVLWLLTGPVAGHGPSALIGGDLHPVGAGSVAAGGLAAGLAAWALLTLLERTVDRPGRAFTVITVVALALSLTGPLGSTADAASTAVLTAMHLLVAAVLIPGLAGSARRRCTCLRLRGVRRGPRAREFAGLRSAPSSPVAHATETFGTPMRSSDDSAASAGSTPGRGGDDERSRSVGGTAGADARGADQACRRR